MSSQCCSSKLMSNDRRSRIDRLYQYLYDEPCRTSR